MAHALYLVAARDGRTHHCTDGSIHARGIAAACQHTDGFDIVVHSSYFPFPFLFVTNYKHLLHEIQLLFVK